jgi:hypothetical protein
MVGITCAMTHRESTVDDSRGSDEKMHMMGVVEGVKEGRGGDRWIYGIEADFGVVVVTTKMYCC